MQRRCNPLISTSRGQRATELASDVWLREAVLMYTQRLGPERAGTKGLLKAFQGFLWPFKAFSSLLSLGF